VSTEEWRPVRGYEGRYEVSDRGAIRSLGFYSHNRWGTQTWRAGRLLRPGRSSKFGHLGVVLVDRDGVHRTHRVHRLVLIAFRGDPPLGRPDCLHEDDDPTNNQLTNLRWGDRHDNAHDSVRNGGHTQTRKKACPLGHALAQPNLVPSGIERGERTCLSCHRAQMNHAADARRSTPRTRYNRGADGFQRRASETWQEEADRRYQHLMR
jgi:hypothetical protein